MIQYSITTWSCLFPCVPSPMLPRERSGFHLLELSRDLSTVLIAGSARMRIGVIKTSVKLLLAAAAARNDWHIKETNNNLTVAPHLVAI